LARTPRGRVATGGVNPTAASPKNLVVTLVPVTLHRSRTWRIEFVILLAALPALTWALLWMRRDMNAGLPPAVVGRELLTFFAAAIAAPIAALKILRLLRFRFVIDADGLTIRTAEITAALRWHAGWRFTDARS
jgi:hypothetical protein